MILLVSFIYLVSIAYIIRTVRNTLYLLSLWQLKEYRWDRMLAHLATPVGKKLLLSPISLVKTVLLSIFLLTIVSFTSSQTPESFLYIYFVLGFSILLFWLIWIFEALVNIKGLIQKKWLLPRFTLKIILILIIVLWFQFLFFFLGKFTNQLIWGILMDRLLGIIIGFLILIFAIPSLFIKRIIINKAKNKIAQLKNLTVIGITGSYGKTSTKEFLTTILSEKYKVAKTPEFTNTDIGIANYVLKELKSDHDIFVIEMGAYKRGEIRAICDIVKPKIGVITGISEQHLELFGSLENTKKAKFELVESLPKDGVAIFNGNNADCQKMAKWVKRLRLTTYTFKTITDVENVKIFTDHIEFSLIRKNKNYLLKINLLGKQAIENVLAAIYVAENLGMTQEEIQKGTTKIVPAPKTMQFAGKLNGMALIDDTFNANPDGVMAAVNYMKIFKGKKILVLTPLIELGSEAEKLHAFLGEKAASVCDLILLTNINYNKSFIGGARKFGGEKKVQIVNVPLGTKLIRENIDKGTVVVFEGKEAGRILEKLLYA